MALALLVLTFVAAEASRPRFVQAEDPPVSEPVGMIRRATGEHGVAVEPLGVVPRPDTGPRSSVQPPGRAAAEDVDTGRLVARESLLETAATAGASAAATVRAKAQSPFLMLGLGQGMASGISRVCGCIAVFAAIRWLCKKTEKTCCGKRSCWYTNPFCAEFLLAAGVDALPATTIKIRVHTVSNVAKKDYFVAFIACERGKGKKKPTLDKKSDELRCTKTSSDLRWESDVTVQVPQGFPELQVCLFQPSSIPGRRASCIAWATLRVEKLISDGPTTYKECKMEMENKTDFAKVVLDFSFETPEADGAKGRPKKLSSAATSNSVSSGWGLRPNKLRVSGRSDISASEPSMAESLIESGDDDDDEDAEELSTSLRTELTHIGQRLEGCLEITNKYGEYVVKYFKVRCKRDTWSWEWYAVDDQKRPVSLDGASYDGRIPFRSIIGISAVPQSVSEFAIKYVNKDKRQCTMVIKRTRQSRDDLVADLHKMLQTIRRFRKARSHLQRTASGLSAASSRRGETPERDDP